jgi:probable rRNA maturation factor
MRLTLEVNNKSKSPIGKDFFPWVVKDTLKRGGADLIEAKKINVSLAIVEPKEIRELNRIYRKHDSVTDVLSFPEYKNFDEMKNFTGECLFLGEIILCYNNIKKYSQKEKINFEGELAKVVSHGVLHLLGFRHGKEMFETQEWVAGNIEK